jgi:hypothetical protein
LVCAAAGRLSSSAPARLKDRRVRCFIVDLRDNRERA